MKALTGGARTAWQNGGSPADLADSAAYYRTVAIRSDGPTSAAAPTSPTAVKEVAYLNGLNPDGTINANSYWGDSGQTAYKWGEGTLGTGATITYSFKAASNFTATEKATFLKAFGMWSSVANVTFVEAANSGTADVLLQRGRDGGAYNSTPTTNGSGATLGEVTGQALISIDTRTPGFDLSGSFDTVGGYGISTIIHEIGHLLGLGHGGDYNGSVNAARDQFSAYDDQMYTIMSYITWLDDDAKYLSQNPAQGTDWGISPDRYQRQAAHSVMQLDILAIQQLYGAAESTPLSGGQTYGFHSTVGGAIASFFDFTINTAPVVTLYNEGTGNALDLSGYAMAQDVDLRAGAFSDIGGLTNNVAIAQGTVIETAIGGSGDDTIRASDVASTLVGGGGDDALTGGAGRDILQGELGDDSLSGLLGQDTLFGGTGADTFWFYKTGDSARGAKRADSIVDFDHAGGDKIDLSMIDAIKGGADDAFTFIGTAAFGSHVGELRVAVSHGDLLIQGDVNGDGKADFTIRLDDVTAIVANDLNL